MGVYLAVTYNALLGKWSAPAERDSPFETNHLGAVKGYEFFRTRRFTTFGMEMDGRPVEYYGRYHFLASNLVSMEIKGLRVTITNKVFDLPVKGSIFELGMKPKLWRLSGDGRMLEETEYFGDGIPSTYFKEPRR